MTMAMSPRISFSHDVDLSIDSHHPLDNYILPSDDFDFIVNPNISNIQDPSPADELFSQGKLLPLSAVIKPATTTPLPSVPPKPSPKKIQLKDIILPSSLSPKPHSANNSKSSSSPFWSMGRSISVGGSRSSKSSYFARSKSTGSYQSQNQRGKSNCYYYSGPGKRSGSCGNGVWINPVINVPAPFIHRGGCGGSGSSSSTNSSSGSGHNGSGNSNFFAYLLCHCRGN